MNFSQANTKAVQLFSVFFNKFSGDKEGENNQGLFKTNFQFEKKPVLTNGTRLVPENETGPEINRGFALPIAQSDMPIVVLNKYGKIEWASPGFLKQYDYKHSQIKGMLWESIKKDTPPDFYNSLVRKKESFAYENKGQLPGGKTSWTLVSAYPVMSVAGTVEKIIVSESNIDHIKQKEEELFISNKIAEHSLNKGNRVLNQLIKVKGEIEKSAVAKEQFFAYMSHEIRTLLNGIIGITELLLKTHLDAEQQKYLSTVKKSGDTLLVVVNDILDFSKIEAGKMNFKQVPFYIRDITDSVVNMFYTKAKEKNILLIKELNNEAESIPLYGDPYRLSQVLMNLVSNAVKFTSRGQVSVAVQKKTETRDDVGLEFIIKDTGCGIPESKISSLFSEFVQVHKDGKYGGTGLGLVITKKIIQLLGGRIEVLSTENEGTTFVVNLSFKKCTPDETKSLEEANRKTEENVVGKALRGVKVLLVEDNLVNQLVAEKLLSFFGAEVEIAKNGRVAIEKLNQIPCDIVLMDVNMPELNGYDTTRYIREKMPLSLKNIPIIALTAHANIEEGNKCIKAGMNDFLFKPFNANQLYDKVEKVLSDKFFNENLIF